MFFNKFVYKTFDRVIGRRNFLEVAASQNNALDLLHFGWRSGHADALGLGPKVIS